jgi:hypothetical protein
VGHYDPYRERPWVTTDWPLAKIDDNWSLIATCRGCWHVRELGRLRKIPNAHKFKTSHELARHLRCSKCGTRKPSLTAEFVGLRRD